MIVLTTGLKYGRHYGKELRTAVVMHRQRNEAHIKSNRAQRNKLRQAKCIRWRYGIPKPIETEIRIIDSYHPSLNINID